MIRSVVYSWIVLAVIMAQSAEARADDIRGAIYEDTKDLVQTLITTELAKDSSELFVCFEPVKLTYFFPETLQALHAGQLSTLGSTAQKESAAAIGEWVRLSFGRTSVDSRETAVPMFSRFDTPQGWMAGSSTLDLPFSLADACSKKTEGRLPFSGGAMSESTVALQEKDGTNIDANAAVSRKLDETIHKTLSADAQLRPLGQCNGVYKAPATTISCELGLAAQSLVLQQKDAAEDHLVGAAVAAFAEIGLAANIADTLRPRAATGVFPHSDRFAYRDTGALAAKQDVQFSKVSTATGIVEDVSQAYYTLWLKFKEVVSTFIRPAGGELPSQEQLRENLSKAGLMDGDVIKGNRDVAELYNVALRLRQIFKQGTSAPSVQQGIVSILTLSKELLKGKTAANILDAAIASAETREFATLMDSLRTGDGHRIVFDSINVALFSASRCDQKASERAAGKVVLAVLRYVSETRDGQAPTSATREAAKSALFEYLSNTGRFGYVSSENGRWNTPWLGGEWLTVSLRASFSPSYINSGHDGLRFPVGVELLTAKWTIRSSPWTYFGIHGTLIDLLSPVSEWVLRDQDKDFRYSGRVWANFLHPRLDAVVGVPAFSTKLALFGGFGLVPAAPVKASDDSYEYEWLGTSRANRVESVKRAGDFWPRFLDFGVGIRYYPL